MCEVPLLLSLPTLRLTLRLSCVTTCKHTLFAAAVAVLPRLSYTRKEAPHLERLFTSWLPIKRDQAEEMSSSIAIPKRKQPNYSHSGFSSSSSSSYASSAGNNSPQASSSAATSSSSTPSTSVTTSKYMERRPSLLGKPRPGYVCGSLLHMAKNPCSLREGLTNCAGPSLSKSEYTVVNVGSPEMPRLVCLIQARNIMDCTEADPFRPRLPASKHPKASTGTKVPSSPGL